MHPARCTVSLPWDEVPLLVAPDAAHWVPRDRPEVVAHSMLKVLDRLTPRPGADR